MTHSQVEGVNTQGCPASATSVGKQAIWSSQCDASPVEKGLETNGKPILVSYKRISQKGTTWPLVRVCQRRFGKLVFRAHLITVPGKIGNNLTLFPCIVFLKKRRIGWIGFEAILLPENDVDTRGSYWKVAQLQHGKQWRNWIMIGWFAPFEAIAVGEISISRIIWKCNFEWKIIFSEKEITLFVPVEFSGDGEGTKVILIIISSAQQYTPVLICA